MSRIARMFVVLVSLTSVAAASGFAQPPPSAATMPAIDAGAPLPVESEVPAALQRRIETPNRDDVRKALAEARAKNLASFHAYMRRGSFPSNVHVDGLANVWRDDDGHFCAAATIMKMSGNEELAIQIAEQTNSLRLADVKQGAVMNWILTSGFTQEELALIQRPFRPVVENPSPEPILADAKLRRAEDARLRALYRSIDKQLVAKQKLSLDRAVDRLVKNPALAWQLVNS